MAKLILFALGLLLVCGGVVGQTDLDVDGTEAPKPNATTPAPTTVPAPTTTPAPEPPTTTPAPEPPTTTPAPEPPTTTPAPEPPTTTPAPEPTPTPPAPPTPAPEADYKYNITEDNVTCIMIEGAINFVVNYSVGVNATKEVTVAVSKHPKEDYIVNGTCNGTENQQEISVTWGSVNQTSSFRLEFESKDGSWSVKSFTASLYLDSEVFANATEAGKTLALEMDYGFAPLSIAVNHSFNCHSYLSAANVTGTIGMEDYKLPLSSTMEGIQFQAYNQVPNEPDFVTSVHCIADHTSDVVPIAVGCALAALVVIVLIAYLVGRRRRSAAYQSV